MEPPSRILVPQYLPFRHLTQPRPVFRPPPLAGGMVRVGLDDDYYAGAVWNDWDKESATMPVQVFDIPTEQRDRWRQAMQAYQAMQEEIDALAGERAGKVAPGWTPAYQPQP